MEIPKPFIHLSPIPYPVESVYTPYFTLPIGPLTAKECVDFFWLTKNVSISASMSLYVKNLASGDTEWDTQKDAVLNSDFAADTSAFSVPPHARCAKNLPLDIYSDGEILQISGPFLAENYGDDTAFKDRHYYYDMYCYAGIGSMTLSTQYCPSAASPYDAITALRFPFEIFGKTYHLNLNMPYAYTTPQANDLVVNYSADVSADFQFYD